MKIQVLALAVMLGGCFDSLVSDPCASGFAFTGGHCVAKEAPDGGAGSDAGDAGPHGGSDAGNVVGPDAPDALVCTLPDLLCSGTCIDVTSDPNNCGACNHVCASGICQMSHCVGEPWGHVIAIGHDYQSSHPAMARVLGNAVSLGMPTDIGVAYWRGTASAASQAGTMQAVASSLASQGRPSHVVTLPEIPSLAGVDTLVVDAQRGDGAAAQVAGAQWKMAIDDFLARGGVVVVLEGVSGVSYRFAQGAGLYMVDPPVDATNQPVVVTNPSDAVAEQVISPYLAETSSVVMPNAPPPVVSTMTGGTLVFHTTR